MPSGRPKGGNNKSYRIEEKEKIILEALEEGISPVARKYDISKGMVCIWVKQYKEKGDKVIDNKYKRGNPLSQYQNKKNLTKEEKLEYENIKLKIENELLKKGYLMKGDGTIVKFMK